MTIIAILSDIHANPTALEAVQTVTRKADTYWILGDTVGYGPLPLQTWNNVKALRPTVWLSGNHDWYVAPRNVDLPEAGSMLPGPSYNERGVQVNGPRAEAWEVAMRHRTKLSKTILKELAALPPWHHLQGLGYGNIVAAHSVFKPPNEGGTPAIWLEEVLVTSPQVFEPFLEGVGTLLASSMGPRPAIHLGGHSHVPTLISWSGENWETHKIVTGVTQKLEIGYFYYLNPGSVGFPLGPTNCPSCALLDTDNWKVTFLSTSYDSEEVRKQMIHDRYPDWVVEKLSHCVDQNGGSGS